MRLTGKIAKTDDEQRLCFGFASAAEIEDSQGDTISEAELERAVYNYVLNSRVGGEMHATKGVATLVESFFVNAEKMKTLGINETWLNHWWVGFKVNDDAVWEKVKNHNYRMFSIGGRARRIKDE